MVIGFIIALVATLIGVVGTFTIARTHGICSILQGPPFWVEKQKAIKKANFFMVVVFLWLGEFLFSYLLWRHISDFASSFLIVSFTLSVIYTVAYMWGSAHRKAPYLHI